MWHATYIQVNQGDSWFLMVENQIDILIPDLSFDHNLCCKYSNGSCKPILDIYVLRSFECYKEFFNLMSFDPSNCFLKTQESIETPIPKMKTHLGVCELIPSHSLALLGVCELIPSHSLALLGVWMWLLGCILNLDLSNPCLGRKPKAKVMIDGKVTIFKPNSSTCAMFSNVTCDPCPFKIRICSLDWEISPWTHFLKNDRNFLKKKNVVHVLVCIAIHIHALHIWCSHP